MPPLSDCISCFKFMEKHNSQKYKSHQISLALNNIMVKTRLTSPIDSLEEAASKMAASKKKLCLRSGLNYTQRPCCVKKWMITRPLPLGDSDITLITKDMEIQLNILALWKVNITSSNCKTRKFMMKISSPSMQ